MNVLAPQFWTDEKVRNLGTTGKLLFACMITDDRVSLPGLYSATPEDFYFRMLPHPQSEVQSAFKTILEAGMAQFDQTHGVLRLPNVWKYAPTPNPNQIGSWKSAWAKIADCPLRYAHIETLRDLAYKGNEHVLAAFDAMFGQIIEGNPRTYLLGRTFLRDVRKASRASARDPSGNLLNTHTNEVFVLEDRRAEPVEPAAQTGDTRTRTGTSTGTSTRTGTSTSTEGSRRVSKGFEKPSERVSKGLSSVTQGQDQVVRTELTLLEGFGKGSERVSKGFEKGSERVDEDRGEALDHDLTYESEEEET